MMKTVKCLLFLMIIVGCTPGDKNEREVKIYPSMAGSGDPWNAITKERLQIIKELNQETKLKRIASRLNMDRDQLMKEIQPLMESNLVKKEGTRFIPDVFIADAQEAIQVYDFAENIGNKLADELILNREQLEEAFSKLSISQIHSLEDQGFMLIGSRILDIGVLGELVKDKTILLPAPHRPSPTRPDGRYYFWIVEGNHLHLGKYGQDDTDIGDTNWHILNFGQTMIRGEINEKRGDFEDKIRATIESDTLKDPEKIAWLLAVPYLDVSDSKTWEEVSSQMSKKLLNVLKTNKEEIDRFFGSLKIAKKSSNTYGDFICWFYHLVYARAIDHLDKKGVITIPEEKYAGIVLYREGEEGLLSK